jgi:hypothetical protein
MYFFGIWDLIVIIFCETDFAIVIVAFCAI